VADHPPPVVLIVILVLSGALALAARVWLDQPTTRACLSRPDHTLWYCLKDGFR